MCRTCNPFHCKSESAEDWGAGDVWANEGAESRIAKTRTPASRNLDGIVLPLALFLAGFLRKTVSPKKYGAAAPIARKPRLDARKIVAAARPCCAEAPAMMPARYFFAFPLY
jgi:hypothetical protein